MARACRPRVCRWRCTSRTFPSPSGPPTARPGRPNTSCKGGCHLLSVVSVTATSGSTPFARVEAIDERPELRARHPPALATGGRRGDVVAFDLSPYDDVCENAEEIHSRLADGTMPCDAPWPDEHVERFRSWIDVGMAGWESRRGPPGARPRRDRRPIVTSRREAGGGPGSTARQALPRPSSRSGNGTVPRAQLLLTARDAGVPALADRTTGLDDHRARRPGERLTPASPAREATTRCLAHETLGRRTERASAVPRPRRPLRREDRGPRRLCAG
jgi:hypothetical protein